MLLANIHQVRVTPTALPLTPVEKLLPLEYHPLHTEASFHVTAVQPSTVALHARKDME